MMTGPPGVGKTMLAQRLPGLLPPLSEAESLEVTAIHSVAGLLSGSTPLITRPPFVAPHHTSSVAALVGGGSGLARPGAVSRAHRGVLFLDECAEIGVSAMEALRTPLEEGEIRLARRDGVARYPARFQLVLAANPCPCAPADPKDCICASMAKRRYLGKLSGPLLDRVDLRVEMHTARAGAFAVDEGESTAVVRERVAAARAVAEERWRPHGIRTNAEVSGALLRRKFRLEAAAMRAAANRSRPRRAQHPRRRPHIAGRVDVGRSRRADLTRGRAGRHGAEFPPGRGCAMTDPVMRAVAYLSRVVEPPCPQLAALVARVGPVEAADRVKRRALDDHLLRLTEARHEIDCAAEDLAVLARLGGRLVTAADAEWPLLAFTAFAGVDTKQRPEAHPPLALWVTGPARLDEVAERAAAIVGTRAATAYGEHVAAELAAGLAERDAAVVSGGAYGIDGAAHRAALAADGFTVAVLAGGIDVSYPAATPPSSIGSVSKACSSPSTRRGFGRSDTGS